MDLRDWKKSLMRQQTARCDLPSHSPKLKPFASSSAVC